MYHSGSLYRKVKSVGKKYHVVSSLDVFFISARALRSHEEHEVLLRSKSLIDICFNCEWSTHGTHHPVFKDDISRASIRTLYRNTNLIHNRLHLSIYSFILIRTLNADSTCPSFSDFRRLPIRYIVMLKWRLPPADVLKYHASEKFQLAVCLYYFNFPAIRKRKTRRHQLPKYTRQQQTREFPTMFINNQA